MRKRAACLERVVGALKARGGRGMVWLGWARGAGIQGGGVSITRPPSNM